MKQTIAIVGLGLIGGSLALALKENTEHTILGIDRDETVLAAALAADAVDITGEEHLSEADILILALPPKGTMEFLEKQAEVLRSDTIVTDVCGVKRAIMDRCVPLCQAHGLHFVGGHPMAGKEHSGFANAEATLFRGASYIFTPSTKTPPSVLDTLQSMAHAIGCASITVTTAEEHDRMIAFTSQLPHVLAGAYVKSPSCPQHKGFSAGSYRDVSRVATVDERLWSQLFLYNADDLCTEIDTLLMNLKTCRDAVASGDVDRVEMVIREGRERKESVTE